MKTSMASFNTPDMWTTQLTQQAYEEKDEPEEDQYQESIVSGNDGRRKVDVFKPQPNDIYGCIGELDVEFDYNVSHKWRGNLTATATVIHTKDKKCYILTAAHNIRANVIFCTSCKTYRVPKINHKKTRCPECNASTGGEQQQKILKATKIIFRDRSIDYNNYGKTLENYECTEEYVPDIKYMQYPKCKDGFDWSFLTFIDSNNIYTKRMQHINIDLIEWNSEYKEERDYGIFGYPTDKDNKMVGMKSKNIEAFKSQENPQTKQCYLQQTGIDTMSGQSGALIWFKHMNEIKVCGIHVGGSRGSKKNPHPYNIGTLVGQEIMKKWKQIKMNYNVKDDGFRIFLVRVVRNQVDVIVKWNGLEKCEKNNIVFSLAITKDNEFIFGDKIMVVRGNNKVRIGGLQEDTFYSLRGKCGDMTDEKSGGECWSNAAITSFKTKSDKQIQMEWEEQPKTINLKNEMKRVKGQLELMQQQIDYTMNEQESDINKLTQQIKDLKETINKLKGENRLMKIKMSDQGKKIIDNKALKPNEKSILANKKPKLVNKKPTLINKLVNEKKESEIKTNNNDDNGLTQYNGKFVQKNVSHVLKVVSPYKIEQVTKTNNCLVQTARMDCILPPHDFNSNVIVYWKIQFIDNNNKNGFNHTRYFIGVISDTVSNMNNAPGCGMTNAYGILGKKGKVTKGNGMAKDSSFGGQYIKDKEIIQIEYIVSKSQILFKTKDATIGILKLPKNKRWYPAVSFNCDNVCQGVICNVLFE